MLDGGSGNWTSRANLPMTVIVVRYADGGAVPSPSYLRRYPRSQRAHGSRRGSDGWVELRS